MEDKVALMMLAYNRLDLTKQTLEGLLESVTIPFHMIVIDNFSDDGTKEYLEGFKASANMVSFHHLRQDKNEGVVVGRNIGLVKANEIGVDWYSTLDNDVEMPKGWLRDSIGIMKANPSYGMLGVNMENKKYPVITKNGFKLQHKPRGNLGTACTVFPKVVHDKLGFFNVEYGLYGEGDADYGMRIRVAGYKMGYVEQSGKHLGVGEYDTGEYRKFKTAWFNKNLPKFKQNVNDYYSRKKSIFIPFP